MAQSDTSGSPSGPAEAGGVRREEAPPGGASPERDKIVAAYLSEATAPAERPEERPLGGRYSVTRRLGSGGQGVVLSGRDGLLEREIAIKALRPGAPPEHAAALRREALLAAQLEHPGIPPVYDLGTDSDGLPFVVMRRVEGDSFEDLLRAREEPAGAGLPAARSLRQLMAAFVQVCQTVSCAHAAGVLHLDLKPANMKLGRYGEAFVLDWGFAARRGSTGLTLRGGTTVYAAPEQLRGDAPDERADIHALGAILYRILARRPHVDFRASGLDEYLRLLESSFPKSLRDRGLGVSRELDAVVMKALARRREDRYRTVAEFIADLDRALEGSPVEALPENAAGRAVRRARSLAAPLAMAAAFAGALGVSLYLGWTIRGMGGRRAGAERSGVALDREAAARRGRARIFYERAREIAAGAAAGGALSREAASAAAELLDGAVGIDPAFADAFAARGRLRASMGDGVGALADLREACRIDPHQASARYRAGVIFLGMGERARAEEEFRALGELGGADDLMAMGLARASLASGEAAGAVRLTEPLLERCAASSELWRIRGYAFALRRGDCYHPNRAHECLSRAMALEGPGAELALAAARAARSAGLAEEALAHVRSARAVRDDPRLRAAERSIAAELALKPALEGRLGPGMKAAAAAASLLMRAQRSRARPETEPGPEPVGGAGGASP